MCKTVSGFTTLMLLVTLTALVGIAACTQPTAPRADCPIQNGSQVCKPS